MKKIVSLFLLLIIFSGCKSSFKNNNLKNNINSLKIFDDKTEVYKNTNNFNEDIEKIEEFHEKNKSIKEREEILITKLIDLPEIENVQSYIIGNKAVIFVDFYGDYSDEKIFELKRQIKKEVIKIDSQIDHVTVNSGLEMIKEMC